VRMNASQPSKPVRRHSSAAKIGHLDLFRSSDHDVFDLALSVKQDADLPICFS
jgi:hypothetical protein